MKIEIDRIPDGGMDIEVDEPVEEYDIEPVFSRFVSPVHISVHADFISGQLLVRGSISIETAADCSRCLKEIREPVVIDDYLFDGPASEGETIDLTGNIREYIIIALPMKRLCTTECKGLCPHCGKDLNVSACDCSSKWVDPRFGGLDKLKFE
ncbi:MAG TPA: DUF177 domain-containing protein [bacterium]|nr:DUF177 domain-containing protein [bacterium]